MTYLYLVLKFWRECIIALLVIVILCLLMLLNSKSGKLAQAESKCSAKIDVIDKANAQALANEQNKVNQVSADYETLKSQQQVKTEVIYKTVQKIVDRPIYLNTCLDDDGLHNINDLIKARQTNNTK